MEALEKQQKTLQLSTNTNILQKGLIRLGITLLLFIVTPIFITMSFKALDNFTEAPKQYIAYVMLALAFALLLFSIVFAVKTFKVIADAFFTNKQLQKTEKEVMFNAFHFYLFSIATFL